MTEFDQQLHLLSGQIARQKKLRAMLQDLYSQQRELEARETELAARRAEEQKDVDRLEGRSLAAFFYGMLGKKEEKLDQEQREAYAAAVKHDSVVRELAAVKQDIRSWENELAALNGCEKQYQDVLAAKTEALKHSDPVRGEQILQLERRIAACSSQLKEIREAADAGQYALSTANGIASSLNSAESWGTWDILGGGLVTDMVKHSHLDEAQTKVEELQMQLRRFKTELSDVTIYADMQIQIDGFLRFADYFFDNLFTDWAVLDHIHASQGQINGVIAQIQTVLNQLNEMKSACEASREQAQTELDAFIVQA
ncbi:hypothetical protein RWV98_19090 [Agathobaculum sp. NTUH-O15-33]|uniref:hypothetical protein n=1 Tax=Agathobaculum sp. NTUH-O15-33 TaxID=3079302 RepID=UPI002958A647|nr:hypothetical protein [Agathobaculum sp. NTUH-O15-33]WNX84651.1 hypothetical protein RWV98_19090 [Agathobaculum sp. NTUH-O15-33]